MSWLGGSLSASGDSVCTTFNAFRQSLHEMQQSVNHLSFHAQNERGPERAVPGAALRCRQDRPHGDLAEGCLTTSAVAGCKGEETDVPAASNLVVRRSQSAPGAALTGCRIKCSTSISEGTASEKTDDQIARSTRPVARPSPLQVNAKLAGVPGCRRVCALHRGSDALILWCAVEPVSRATETRSTSEAAQPLPKAGRSPQGEQPRARLQCARLRSQNEFWMIRPTTV